MKDKTYKQRTRFLGIPVVGNNDSIWPEVELKKYQIIENLLLAGLKGMQNCIFDEGDLSLEKKQNGEFFAVLRPIGIRPALEGIVGSAYFLIADALVWDNLVVGKVYYLYVVRTVHTFADSSSVRVITSEYEQPSKLNILVGKVDLTNENPSLDRAPNGKIHVFDLTKHSMENDNPHGNSISQDELLIRKKLILGDGQDTEIVIRVGNEQISMPTVCLIPSVVTFMTNGMEGTVVTSLARVGFIHTSRMSGATGKLGEVSIGYFGQDSKVPNEQSFIVYNDGDANIPMKALIYHG